MNNILAVVVTYNRRTLLEECINALLQQSMKRFDILIVDNASTDDTSNLCCRYVQEYDNIIYENTGKNIGGAGGFHFGMRYGVEKGYNFFWVMDDDTIAECVALEELWKAHERLNGEYGFLSSAALWSDRTLCKMNTPGMNDSFDYEEYCKIKDGLIRIERATFVSLFVKRETVEKIGLPIKDFFIWCDDIEFTNRISKQYKSYFVVRSQVLHKMKKNVGSDISTDDVERVPRYYYEYRNFSYIAKQNGMLWKLYQLYRFGHNLVNITKYSKNKRMLRYKIVFKGYFSGLLFNPEVEYVTYKRMNDCELF